LVERQRGSMAALIQAACVGSRYPQLKVTATGSYLM
jgi:hypothetical protein